MLRSENAVAFKPATIDLRDLRQGEGRGSGRNTGVETMGRHKNQT